MRLPAEGTVLYRAMVDLRASMWGGRAEGYVRVEMYKVVRTTPCGVYLEDHYEHGMGIHANTGLKGRVSAWFPWPGGFAMLTREAALEGLVARKEAHCRHARRRLEGAETMLRVARAARAAL